jgi:UDP-N-acetylglucosamine 2-epimerase (non-hydrolysing)
MKVLTVFGTRPEAIKMMPVIIELKRYSDKFNVIVAVSGQHREMLDQVLNLFEIIPDYDLNIMRKSQSLSQITCGVLNGVENILEKENPDIVLVQGDTSTTFAGALAAFYHQTPVGHIEAGLRTYNKYNPFPEEKNRQLASILADLHFAPTQKAKENLIREGIQFEKIHVTGNTVVDALFMIIKRGFKFKLPPLSTIDFDNEKIILVTSHRRENFGEPLESICLALKEIVINNKDTKVIFPVHLNPKVRSVVNDILGDTDRIHLIEPLDYITFVHLMSKVYLILTDSGGIQEEAASLGKPILVMRDTTERPEAVEAGIAKLVGTDKERIFANTKALLDNGEEYKKVANSVNPFGDGKAGERITKVLEEFKK